MVVAMVPDVGGERLQTSCNALRDLTLFVHKVTAVHRMRVDGSSLRHRRKQQRGKNGGHGKLHGWDGAIEREGEKNH